MQSGCRNVCRDDINKPEVNIGAIPRDFTTPILQIRSTRRKRNNPEFCKAVNAGKPKAKLGMEAEMVDMAVMVRDEVCDTDAGCETGATELMLGLLEGGGLIGARDLALPVGNFSLADGDLAREGCALGTKGF